MAFRFRRSIRIAPGIRVNIGKSGASLSVGRRWASVTVGKRGAYANVGLPGTGLSFRERLDGGRGGRSQRESQRLSRQNDSRARAEAHEAAKKRQAEALSKVQLSLDEASGAVTIIDAHGEPLTPAFTKLLWQQQGDAVQEWLQENADQINGNMDALLNIHQYAPSPNSEPVYTQSPYDEPEPERPSLPDPLDQPSVPATPRLGWFARFFPSRRRAHEEQVSLLAE